MTRFLPSCAGCVMVAALASYAGETQPTNSDRHAMTTASREGTRAYLDADHPSVAQPLASRDHAQGRKFVRVEVPEVVNPERHSLTFEVYYQPPGAAKTYLGSFSLYPADNPGTFLVATQGKVGDEGAIVVALVTPDRVERGDTIRVGVAKISLVDG